MYVTIDYYLNNFLGNRDPVIPDTEFKYWEKQASRELDHVTFDRLKDNPNLVSDEVRDCMCELAEYLYQQDQYTRIESEDGTKGQLASYSNDGESASYDLSGQKDLYSASAKGPKIYNIISKYLSRTGLMYRGL